MNDIVGGASGVDADGARHGNTWRGLHTARGIATLVPFAGAVGRPTAPDPGLAEFVQRLRASGIQVTSTKMETYGAGEIGEVDVVTGKALIEFKSGTPNVHDLIDQVQQLETHVERPVVVFISNQHRSGASRAQAAMRHNVFATNSFDELPSWLR